MSSTTEIILDPVESSRLAGLRYVSDAKPGITRKRRGKSFQYFDSEGKAIRNKDEIARIKSLAIPPAWTDVWICPRPNGHLQATGRDARACLLAQVWQRRTADAERHAQEDEASEVPDHR